MVTLVVRQVDQALSDDRCRQVRHDVAIAVLGEEVLLALAVLDALAPNDEAIRLIGGCVELEELSESLPGHRPWRDGRGFETAPLCFGRGSRRGGPVHEVAIAANQELRDILETGPADIQLERLSEHVTDSWYRISSGDGSRRQQPRTIAGESRSAFTRGLRDRVRWR